MLQMGLLERGFRYAKSAILCISFLFIIVPAWTGPSVAAPIRRYYGYSFNWSGYTIVVGGEVVTTPSGNKYWGSTSVNPIYSYTVSYVYGEWYVPKMDTGKTGYMADVSVWVGIDGYDSDTVEQIGTSSEYNSYTGEINYYAWWEVYPKFSHRISAMKVKQGDHIAAYVKFINKGSSTKITDRGVFELSLMDLTTGRSFTIMQGPLQPGLYQRSSAEWVVERPAFYNPSTKQAYFAELPPFTSTTFIKCMATVTAPEGIPIHYDRMWMVAPYPLGYGYGDAYGTSITRYIIAETSPKSGDLIGDGTFTVIWKAFGTKAVSAWSGPTPE